MRRKLERDRLHLLHMPDAAQLAQEFVQKRERADLENDRLFQLALVKTVELIGESASQITDQLKAEHSEIPWRDMIDMRHILVHNDWRVELDVVWDTIKNDIPVLIVQLQQLIESGDERRQR